MGHWEHGGMGAWEYGSMGENSSFCISISQASTLGKLKDEGLRITANAAKEF